MEKQVSKNWYLVLFKGIIMVLLALLIFSSPGDALLTYVLYVGIGFIIAGIVRIYQGFSAKGVSDNWGWIVFEGAMDLFLGYILMIHPDLTVSLLPIMIGFWAALYGLYLVIDAFSGKGSMGVKLISGILLFMLANAIIFNPVSFGLGMEIWIGVTLFMVGIYNILMSFSSK